MRVLKIRVYIVNKVKTNIELSLDFFCIRIKMKAFSAFIAHLQGGWVPPWGGGEQHNNPDWKKSSKTAWAAFQDASRMFPIGNVSYIFQKRPRRTKRGLNLLVTLWSPEGLLEINNMGGEEFLEKIHYFVKLCPISNKDAFLGGKLPFFPSFFSSIVRPLQLLPLLHGPRYFDDGDWRLHAVHPSMLMFLLKTSLFSLSN